jgi:hypothetical protein
VPPWVSIAPSGELTDTRLQHLVRMETGVCGAPHARV